MRTVVLITIRFLYRSFPEDCFHYVSKNEPNKSQIVSLLNDIKDELSINGTISYLKFVQAENGDKTYVFDLGENEKCWVSVDRMEINEFEKI